MKAGTTKGATRNYYTTRKVVRVRIGQDRYTSRPMPTAKAEALAAKIKAAGIFEGQTIDSVTLLNISQDFLNTLALS